MTKLVIYLLSALLLVSSAVAEQYDSIYPFKYQGVKTCYWVAQAPATRCLLTVPKKLNGQIVDAHVYTHCRSTCETQLTAAGMDQATTDSEMRFPLLGLSKNPPKNEYFFKTCKWAKCEEKCARDGIAAMCPASCAAAVGTLCNP